MIDGDLTLGQLIGCLVCSIVAGAWYAWRTR